MLTTIRAKSAPNERFDEANQTYCVPWGGEGGPPDRPDGRSTSAGTWQSVRPAMLSSLISATGPAARRGSTWRGSSRRDLRVSSSSKEWPASSTHPIRRRRLPEPTVAKISCPACGHAEEEELTTHVCLFFYECPACDTVVRPKPGDCCAFCSYSDRLCPSREAGEYGGPR